MKSEIENAVLVELVRRAIGGRGGGAAAEPSGLDAIREEARERLFGPERNVAEATRIAAQVLTTVDRYEALVLGLGGVDGEDAVRKVRGAFEEILDEGRVRLAHGAPVVVLQNSRRTA